MQVISRVLLDHMLANYSHFSKVISVINGTQTHVGERAAGCNMSHFPRSLGSTSIF